MSWRAIFLDGPLEGKAHDRLFMGAWQKTLRFAPVRPETTPDGWALVGLDWDDHWPGQITYVRVERRSQLLEVEPGEDEGWAAYRVEEP